MADNIRFYKDAGSDQSKYVTHYAVDKSAPMDDPYDSTHYPAAQVDLYKGHYTDAAQANRLKKPGEQLQLFGIQPSVIHGAYADKSMRSVTPTVLGMAINEAKNIGMGLTYSENLSRHSTRLAKKALEMGVFSENPANPKFKQKNEIGFEGLSSFEHVVPESELPDLTDITGSEEVAKGRKTIRDIVRSARPAPEATHMGQQFHQPELGE